MQPNKINILGMLPDAAFLRQLQPKQTIVITEGLKKVQVELLTNFRNMKESGQNYFNAFVKRQGKLDMVECYVDSSQIKISPLWQHRYEESYITYLKRKFQCN